MMLSTLSHSMSPSYPPSHDPPSTMAAPLAILPQRQPVLQPHPLNLPQRPKLHINTQQLRTFGKGSSLRLDTLSAVSPTVRNTFSNAYEAPASAVPVLGRPSKPRLSIDSDFSKSSDSSTPSSSTPNSACTLSSTITSATSNDSATISIPYKQPHNLASILSNSPARLLLPRKMGPARPLFPAEKKVSFRTPLEEEIKNVKYTMAHSDLEPSSVSSSSSNSTLEGPAESESESESSTISLSIPASSSSEAPSSPSVQSPSEQSSSSAFSSLESSPRPRRPRAGDKRDSSESESDSDACPQTPVAGRRKRRRDWRWTLGPLPSDKSSSTSTSETTTSEDSN